MHLPKQLLVAVIAMGVLGSARAEMVAPVLNPDTIATSDSGFYFAPGEPVPYSFADIVNLPRGAGPLLLAGDTLSRVSGEGSLAELSNVSDATPMRSAGTNVAGSLMGAILTLNDEMDDLSAAVVPDKLATPRSGNVWHTGAGFLFSTAEIPEPADWMTLLCGLVVVAFMARRKSGSLAD